MYASIHPHQNEKPPEEPSSPTSVAPNVSNPMYSSIDGLEARRSFVIHRSNERLPGIPRSNSTAAVTTMRVAETIPPAYSTIVPRHLRNHNHSSSSDQDQLGQEEGQEEGQGDQENTQTYSTLKY